ncbi:MAG: hypothetical protein QOI61_721, partial [Actinomycetota bacterium]
PLRALGESPANLFDDRGVDARSGVAQVEQAVGHRLLRGI